MLPTYLPHLLDEESAGAMNSPIFLGWINVYLQHKFSLFRKTPKWLDNLFNKESLLRWVAGKRGMTSPRELGEITLSTLRGKGGPLAKEVDKVIDWFKQDYQNASQRADHGMIELVQRPGEMLYVPAGWGHAVINTANVVRCAWR